MAEKKLEARDKKVQKMSRDGLTEENLHSGKRKMVSNRVQEFIPAPSHEAFTPANRMHGMEISAPEGRTRRWKQRYQNPDGPGSGNLQRDSPMEKLIQPEGNAALVEADIVDWRQKEPQNIHDSEDVSLPIRAAPSDDVKSGNTPERQEAGIEYPVREIGRREGKNPPTEPVNEKWRHKQSRKQMQEEQPKMDTGDGCWKPASSQPDRESAARSGSGQHPESLTDPVNGLEPIAGAGGSAVCAACSEQDVGNSEAAGETGHVGTLSEHSVRMEGVREHSTGRATAETAAELAHSRRKKQQQPKYRRETAEEPEPYQDGMEPEAAYSDEGSPETSSHNSENPGKKADTHDGFRMEQDRAPDNSLTRGRKKPGQGQPVQTEERRESRRQNSQTSNQAKLDQEQGKKPGRLSFDDEDSSMARGAGLGIGRKAAASVAVAAVGYAHMKIHEAEQDNSAVEAAHRSEVLAEGSVRKAAGKSTSKKAGSHSSRQQRKEEMESEPGRLQFAPAENTVEPTQGKEAAENVTEKTRTIRHFWQKKQYQKAYAAAKKGETASGEAAKATRTVAQKARQAAKSLVTNHKGAVIALAVLGLLVLIIGAGLSSCSAMLQGVQNSFVSSTYPSSDDDIYATEDAYAALESALNAQVNRMESTHPGFDEYNYQIDEISHNPYQLISYLTAVHGEFTYSQISGELQALLSRQYTLTVQEVAEIRARTETRTGTREVTDPETGETTEEEYEYEVEVEYEYKILNVTLVNHGFDWAVRSSMTSDQAGLYAIYNSTYGNRSYLFDTATLPTYAGDAGGFGYEIPAEALSDERFARMITEAEKYLGFPYVWGGSSPSTSFDCSGFVSWVINNCGNGWNVGRQTADGLRSCCAYVSPQDAKPGDLIFFQGTYNTSGASHVGIYVGNGMMIHCGSPIQYTSIETSYWQQHFLAFGRIQ